MDEREKRIERNKQTRLETLGTNEPMCLTCPETHFACFENHHLAGRRYHGIRARECKNCHAKLTAAQKGHPPPHKDAPTFEEVVGRFILGLADFFELLIVTLRQFGQQLIAQATQAANGGKAPKPGLAT